MIAFIKNYSLENIKNKLLVLYILNVADIVFSLILLNTGFYMEANTLMSKAVQRPIIGFLSKVVFPAALFTFIYFRMQKATDRQIKYCNYIINGSIVFYSLINAFHIIGFAILYIFISIYK